MCKEHILILIKKKLDLFKDSPTSRAITKMALLLAKFQRFDSIRMQSSNCLGALGSHGLGMSQEPWEPGNAALPLTDLRAFCEPLHLSFSLPLFSFLMPFLGVFLFGGAAGADQTCRNMLLLE